VIFGKLARVEFMKIFVNIVFVSKGNLVLLFAAWSNRGNWHIETWNGELYVAQCGRFPNRICGAEVESKDVKPAHNRASGAGLGQLSRQAFGDDSSEVWCSSIAQRALLILSCVVVSGRWFNSNIDSNRLAG